MNTGRTAMSVGLGCNGCLGLIVLFVATVAVYAIWLWSGGMEDPRVILNLAFVAVAKVYGWLCVICAAAFFAVLGLSVVSRR